jgi:hypothetical protein
MSLWWLMLLIAAAGAVGGIVNAYISDNGFVFPKREPASSKGDGEILRPGFLGNLFVGAIAAVVSWGLYGPLASFVIAGTSEAIAQNPATSGVTLAAVTGAIIVGVGGARILSSEVDKKLLSATATEAAASQAATSSAQQIASASSPVKALRIAKEMKKVA